MRPSRPTALLLALGLVATVALVVAAQLGPRTQAPEAASSGTTAAPGTAASAGATPATGTLIAPSAPVIVAAIVPPPGEPIRPGRYTMPDFLPRITFELEARGWFTYDWGRGFLHLSSANGLSLFFVRPAGVFSLGPEPVPATTSAEAAEALSATDKGRIVGASDSRMDGHTGQVIEIDRQELSATPIAILKPQSDDNVGVFLVPGRHLWVAFIDTPDGLLAIVADVATDSLDRDLAWMEPILESITIGR